MVLGFEPTTFEHETMAPTQLHYFLWRYTEWSVVHLKYPFHENVLVHGKCISLHPPPSLGQIKGWKSFLWKHLFIRKYFPSEEELYDEKHSARAFTVPPFSRNGQPQDTIFFSPPSLSLFVNCWSFCCLSTSSGESLWDSLSLQIPSNYNLTFFSVYSKETLYLNRVPKLSECLRLCVK